MLQHHQIRADNIVSPVARVNSQNHYKPDAFSWPVNEAYINTLTTITRALTDPFLVHSDECLASVWLWGFSGILQPKPLPIEWQENHSGPVRSLAHSAR